MLISGVAFFMAAWNFNFFDNHMVTRLYKMEKSEADKQVYKKYFERSDFMHPRKLYNPREYLLSKVPKKFKCCACCRPSRLEKGFERGRELLTKETNIIEIIKSRRYFTRALRLLLTKDQRMRLKERSRYISLNPDADQSKRNLL